MKSWTSIGRFFAVASTCVFAVAGCSADAGEEDDFDTESALAASQGDTTSAAITVDGSRVFAHFANPTKAKEGRDLTILKEFERLVLSAPKGSTIRVGIFNLTVPFVAKALIKAQTNGAKVEIVADGGLATSTNDAAKLLRDGITDDHYCKGAGDGCVPRSNTGIMHSKWMTLTAATDPTGHARANVSWFGSANLTFATGAESFNNTITVYDDKRLHDGFVTYFDTLRRQDHFDGDDFYDASKRRGYYDGATATVFASPEQDTDLVYARLNDFKPTDGCRIRVAQAMFHDGRARLASLLASHKRNGCKVWVVVGQDDKGAPAIDAKSLQTLRDARIPVHTRDHLHSKTVVVRASYDGAMKSIVYTGSHNWTASANDTNDEIFVRMDDSDALYRTFLGHFNDQYNGADAL
jgi:hypothetical protein